MITAARIRPGHAVLVNGATGGIGSAAVQLLSGLGAHVTAVCAAEHTALVTDLGADRTIDFTTEDFTQDAVHLRRGLGRGGQILVRRLPATVETSRDLPFLRARPAFPEPTAGAHHADAPRPESHVPHSEDTIKKWSNLRAH